MTGPTPTPCKVILVDLASATPALTLDQSAYRSAGVFFLLDGVPLGHQYLSASDFPLTADQVWETAVEAVLPALTPRLVTQTTPGASAAQQLGALDPLATFRAATERRRRQTSTVSASVVICTHERPAALARCLASLQNLAVQPVEFLVIDNAPKTDATRLVVSEFPNVRYKVEPRPGLSYARNTGIRASRGDVIAFTDDDVVVTEHWLGELLQPFSDPAVAGTTGAVIPAELSTREQAFFESWLSFNRGWLPVRFTSDWLRRTRGAPPVWDLGAGANMALRRSAFDKTGLFDTRLGAGASGCSEDSELWYRLLAAGFVCEYTPASLVLHYHRADRSSLTRQMRLYSRGHVAALLIQYARHRNFGDLLRIFLGLPIYHARKIAASLVFPERLPFWLASAGGYFAGLFYLLWNRRDRSRQGLTALSASHESIGALSAREFHGDQ